MKEAFAKLVMAADTARLMDSQMTKLGYSSNVYAEIFGNIADAVYTMLGEDTDTFEESFTCATLRMESAAPMEKASLLVERFRSNLQSRE